MGRSLDYAVVYGVSLSPLSYQDISTYLEELEKQGKVSDQIVYPMSSGWTDLADREYTEWFLVIGESVEWFYNQGSYELHNFLDLRESLEGVIQPTWDELLRQTCHEYSFPYSDPTWVLVLSASEMGG